MGLCKQWLWVGFFCLGVAFVYSQSMKKKKEALTEYAYLLVELEKTRENLAVDKEQLLLKIASQADPAWIEMILMRDLGVVPEGYLKVYFKK
jgi:hypothetical protein